MENQNQTTNERLNELQEVIQVLEAQRQEIEEKLQLLGDAVQELEQKEDIDNTVQILAETDVKQAVDTNLETQLRDVVVALKRVEAGTYGVCKYCEQPIAIARLRIRPTSNSCVECKKTLKEEF